ncbi:MAG: hypothetical protein ACRC92_20365 [Peptostreptococcaceae bacterium]
MTYIKRSNLENEPVAPMSYVKILAPLHVDNNNSKGSTTAFAPVFNTICDSGKLYLDKYSLLLTPDYSERMYFDTINRRTDFYERNFSNLDLKLRLDTFAIISWNASVKSKIKGEIVITKLYKINDDNSISLVKDYSLDKKEVSLSDILEEHNLTTLDYRYYAVSLDDENYNGVVFENLIESVTQEKFTVYYESTDVETNTFIMNVTVTHNDVDVKLVATPKHIDTTDVKYTLTPIEQANGRVSLISVYEHNISFISKEDGRIYFTLYSNDAYGFSKSFYEQMFMSKTPIVDVNTISVECSKQTEHTKGLYECIYRGCLVDDVMISLSKTYIKINNIVLSNK